MAAVVWRKSSRSGANGGNCVEVARIPGALAVRDSKNPEGGRLVFGARAFDAFLTDIKEGRIAA